MPVTIGNSTPNRYRCDAPSCRSEALSRYLPLGWLRFKIETLRSAEVGHDVPLDGAVACRPACVPGALAALGERLKMAAIKTTYRRHLSHEAVLEAAAMDEMKDGR